MNVAQVERALRQSRDFLAAAGLDSHGQRLCGRHPLLDEGVRCRGRCASLKRWPLKIMS